MDAAGITAQVAFPNNLGLGGQGVANASSDRALLDACIEMYNDYGAEAARGVRQPDPPDGHHARVGRRRLCPRGAPGALARLAGREHHLRPLRPRGPDLADHVWDPLWSTCMELELPVHFHIGNSDSTMDLYDSYSWGSNPDSLKWAISGMMLFIGNARSIVNLIGSGVLERHPELQIVSVESGVGWIPFVMEALLYEMAENAPRDLAKLSLTPLEYFQRQIYADDLVRAFRHRQRRPEAGRGPDHVRDRFSAPHLPLPRTAEERGGEPRSAQLQRPGEDPEWQRHAPLQAGVGPHRHFNVCPKTPPSSKGARGPRRLSKVFQPLRNL